MVADTVVVVGTYSAALYLFAASCSGGAWWNFNSPSCSIKPLGSSTAFGPSTEALLVVPDPADGSAANVRWPVSTPRPLDHARHSPGHTL